MTFKLATWNINSVRLRLPIVAQLLEAERPDALCLQETKCRDAEFPLAALRKLGYEHIEINGQKGYHGVATLSRWKMKAVERRGFCDKGDARHLSTKFLDGPAKGVTLHNVYVPAGGDEPDPVINEKFAHKLAFVDEMRDWFGADGVAKKKAILVGDLNIAPLEHDVWSHRQMLKVVSHTPVEVEKFAAAQAAGPWVDVMRRFVPENEKLYTWWSYRAADWRAADRGRRLDHVWSSGDVAAEARSLRVLKDARGWERPSDHVPVLADFDL
ncbi:MAG: exodeoxyribonuclease III [Methylobacteriaceae bacterium]|nr:exodeoxyribonuclease III [Methylobacteriaceae bacterium]